MLKNCRKNYKGFTLLELLVVVLIIGILAAIALPQYKLAVDKSRFAALMDITKALTSANERFYLTNGRYSTNLNELDVEIKANRISNDGATAFFDWGKCRLLNQRQVYCINNKKLQNEFTIFYYFSDHPVYRRQSLCIAFTTQSNSRYAKLCKSIGTYYVTDKGCTESPSGSCRVYKITG